MGSLGGLGMVGGSKWRAVIPLKYIGDRKSRLSTVLSPRRRAELTDRMALHVVERLRGSSYVDEILVLSASDIALPGVRWVRDEARGLNIELDHLRHRLQCPMIVVHADLPFLQSSEIDLMLEQAQRAGSALAPDRHGSGTNALALRPTERSFSFAFGSGSCARHRASLGPRAAIIDQQGLSLDLDTPDDLADARKRGLLL